LDPELDNLRTALRWFIGEGLVEASLRLAAAATVVWFYRGQLAEGRRWLEEALTLDSPDWREWSVSEAASGVAPTADSRRLSLRGWSLKYLGILAVMQGDLEVAEQAEQHSLELSRHVGDPHLSQESLLWLGRVAQLRGDFARARSLLEEGLAILRQSISPNARWITLIFLAEVASEQGRLDDARRLAEESSKIANAGNLPIGMCKSSTFLGELHTRLGHPETARIMWEETLARVRETHQKHIHVIPLLIGLGRLATQHMDTDHRGRSLLAEGLTLARELSRWELTRGLDVVAEVAGSGCEWELALHFAGASAAMRDAMGTPRWPSEQARLDPVISHAREALSATAADACWMRGWTMSADQTVNLALGSLREPTRGARNVTA
jgi:tetratricopeptide (TPR) repeat protein